MNSNTKKTLVNIILVVIVLGSISTFMYLSNKKEVVVNTSQQPITTSSSLAPVSKSESSPHFTIGTTTINLEIADTEQEREVGLSKRTSLAENTGMLFIFSKSDYWAFWMKDTLIPLDMIWLDARYKIVGIKENATPDSYPESFTSDAPALYVIEVNKGFVQKHEIKLGSVITIDLANYK